MLRSLFFFSFFWGICDFIVAAVFTLSYAIIQLTDMALRLPALSFNHVFEPVWQTAAPFMSLTFPAGYWISKHTHTCARTHIHTHTYTDTQIHTHTHTGTRSHGDTHTALGQRHKNVHLALCTDDSTRQVKHSIVKFCGSKSAFYGGKTLDGLLLPLGFYFLAHFYLLWWVNKGPQLHVEAVRPIVSEQTSFFFNLVSLLNVCLSLRNKEGTYLLLPFFNPSYNTQSTSFSHLIHVNISGSKALSGSWVFFVFFYWWMGTFAFLCISF